MCYIFYPNLFSQASFTRGLFNEHICEGYYKEKKAQPQVGFEPTTSLVYAHNTCAQILSYNNCSFFVCY